MTHIHAAGDRGLGGDEKAITVPAFTPIEDSLFLTLCARALDNRSPHPVLADAMADEIVRKLEYDYDQFHLNTNLIITVALRAKKLDEVASGFFRRHPDAIGLDLGAGWIRAWRASLHRPALTGTTSTSPVSSLLEGA